MITTKRTSKLITMALIVLTICAILTNVFADNMLIEPGDIQATSTDAATSAQNIAGSILGLVQVIGIAVAVIMLIVLAIKYITAAPNDKAEIKKHAVVYIVGAVVLFGASGLLGILKGFASNIK